MDDDGTDDDDDHGGDFWEQSLSYEDLTSLLVCK